MKKRLFVIILSLLLFIGILPSKASVANYSYSGLAEFIEDYLEIKYSEVPKTYVFVSVKRQKLFLIEGGKIQRAYPISSAKKGIGNYKNSEKTPIGMHRIQRKIGEGVPEGGLFEERRYTGETATILKGEQKSPTDDITSRIIWLSGTEQGVNKGGEVDSFLRYIYIHGTSEEGLIGAPASHGCIRMLNRDVIELFQHVEVGLPVLILPY